MKQGFISQCFTNSIIKLLCENTHCGDEISNLWPLIMLITVKDFGEGLGKLIAHCTGVS